MFSVEIEDLVDTLRGVAVPEQTVLETGRDEFERQRRLADLSRPDHEADATGLEPRVEKVVFDASGRWSREKIVDG